MIEGLSSNQVYSHFVNKQLTIGQMSNKTRPKRWITCIGHDRGNGTRIRPFRYESCSILGLDRFISFKSLGQIHGGFGCLCSQAEGSLRCGNSQQEKSWQIVDYSGSDASEIKGAVVIAPRGSSTIPSQHLSAHRHRGYERQRDSQVCYRPVSRMRRLQSHSVLHLWEDGSHTPEDLEVADHWRDGERKQKLAWQEIHVELPQSQAILE